METYFFIIFWGSFKGSFSWNGKKYLIHRIFKMGVNYKYFQDGGEL